MLTNSAAATLTIPSFVALGPETFAIRAWPTLHKDLDLARPLAERSGAADSNLLRTAADAIATMAQRRAPWEATRQG